MFICSISKLLFYQLSPGGVTKSKIQSNELRNQLREKFPTDKLFLLSDDFNGTQLMDLTLMLGTVVGIIKQGDPMGNKERFFVTDGGNLIIF